MTGSSYYLGDEAAMVSFGEQLGAACQGQATLYLEGDLGRGKTTLSRGVLAAFGHQGAVKSPTYTLVEPYDLDGALVYHFDLYRLSDPEELEFLGIRDYFEVPAVRLIEWPERGAGVLPQPDLRLRLELELPGRRVHLSAQSAAGEAIAQRLQVALSAAENR